ncbi:DUF2971 domain-containing protein [Methanococcoides sp. AM1]|uniref:DUF2971 domain-containing protein n=1 Tax=Methanococcoides sp. AM1 TaxID=1201011 RepID=UPI001438298F|nr:DUF2971 domain-containing protein [Methanococcoides sp. AM1]
MVSVNYFEILIDFLKNNIDKDFESPRRVFQRKRVPKNFKIIDLNESKQKIKLQFRSEDELESGSILYIDYWRLKEAISFLNGCDFVPIGSSISENYNVNSLEGRLKEIAKTKYNKSTDTKTAPHIVDLLALSGNAELGETISDNGRKVDGVRFKPLKLLKFRSLTNKEEFDRAKEIIEKGKFYCSKLWDHNDPMEGVFSTYCQESIDTLFSEKNATVFCSLSHRNALNNPLLWGYYASGFKGVAIEIEVTNENSIDNGEIKKITYDNDSSSNNKTVKEIITRKFPNWEHENEYRFLINGDKGAYFIGNIVRVYFGSPYENVVNFDDIKNKAKYLNEYNKFRKQLKDYIEITNSPNRIKIDIKDFIPNIT